MTKARASRFVAALLALFLALFCAACGPRAGGLAPDASVPSRDDASAVDATLPADAGVEAAASCTGVDLPALQAVDAAAAARGQSQFTTNVLGQGYVPVQAMTSLWIVWGTGQPASTAAYWTAFEARYGFYPAPFDNGGYPMGVRAAQNGQLTLDCLTCHATVVAGQTVIGTGNSQLDLQGLFDDLVQLRAVAQELGISVPPLPFTIAGRTGAAGANDAFGLGMYLATQYDPSAPRSLHTTAGFQQAPSWWTLRYRDAMYLDGSGHAGGFRTMMATLLASGESLATMQAQDAMFADVYQYLLSLPAPCWSLSTIDPSARARGETVFEQTCASCHGIHTGAGASYPGMTVPAATVGTDPVRAQSFAAEDAAWIDATWFGGNGQPPYAMTATGGYLAPPLAGVWASAPYFHNGSVPDLAGVLDSSQRPTRWQRTGNGAADYDPTTVGWRYTTVAASVGNRTIAQRLVYDTTLPGLSNAGHTYGDALTSTQRADLLEYLRSL